MYKILLLISASLLITQRSTADQLIGFNPAQHGPGDCLLSWTDECPVDFLQQVFCESNQRACAYNAERKTYLLETDLFIARYDLEISSIEFWRLPFETLHELFEYAICESSPNSCYQLGRNGLTIYQNLQNCPTLGCRNDSAVCQITPEACSGHSSQ